MIEPALLADILRPAFVDGAGPLVVRTHALLRSHIIDMRLLPWQVVPEKEVAACLAISKTPVREAIIRLAEEGLVVVVPKSRTYVAPINLDRFQEGCFVRLQLEAGAALRAANERTLEDVCQLRASLACQAQALERHDFAAFRHLDESFHGMVLAAAGLPGVARVVEQARVEVDRIRSLKQRLAIRRTAGVLHEHRAIVEAIAERDGPAAEAAMRAHLGPVEEKVWELGDDPRLWELFVSINRERPRVRQIA